MIRSTPRFLTTGSTVLEITRAEQGSHVNGRWVEGGTQAVEIKANVQPMREQELLLLPEADRSREWLNVYSAEQIRTERQGQGGWAADEFEWQGDIYKVMRVKSYKMGVLDHYEAKAARKELTPS